MHYSLYVFVRTSWWKKEMSMFVKLFTVTTMLKETKKPFCINLKDCHTWIFFFHLSRSLGLCLVKNVALQGYNENLKRLFPRKYLVDFQVTLLRCLLGDHLWDNFKPCRLVLKHDRSWRSSSAIHGYSENFFSESVWPISK